MQSAEIRSEPTAEPGALFRPGHNCWRLARADRAAVLIDGESYFSAFADAIERARRSIIVLGWDFNSSVRLRPAQGGDGFADQIGQVLDRAVARRPHLHAYVLDWDFSMIYAMEREFLPRWRLARRTHRRFHFQLDNCHPVGAAHHQKIAVIDDAIAFVGGFDFGPCRWDTSEHHADDPRRIDPWGRHYSPFHDVQMAVDGEAAAALAVLARHRWRCATGQVLSPVARGVDPWPAGLAADFTDVDVAIARTGPAFRSIPEVREVETLYLDAIAAARRYLYFENQYLTSARVGDALAARLQEPDGPEIVILQPRQCEGWLEQTTMGVLRARLLRRVREADHRGRLRVYHPVVPDLGDRRLTVHSKLLIVDDRLLRIGSANLNNRSMGIDSECDVAIDGGADAELRRRIAAVRDRLLGEHLGQDPARVGRVLATSGSLLRTIDALNGGPRRLELLDAEVGWVDTVVPDRTLIDPERPIDAAALLAQLVPGQFEPVRRNRLWPLGAAALIAGVLLHRATRRREL
jgi:phosphatidylserine/phosphatidylglycerophosphate/cardiolipin synthase-like enzyme